MVFTRTTSPVLTRPPIDNGKVQVSITRHVLARATERAGGSFKFVYPETIKIVRGGRAEAQWILPVLSHSGYKMYLIGEWCVSDSGEYDNTFKALTLLTKEHLRVTGVTVLDRVKVTVASVVRRVQ